MGYYLKIIFAMLLIRRSKLSDHNACSTSANYILLADNSRADVSIIHSEYTQFFSMCTHLCLAHNLCTSFNYNSETLQCELVSYNHIGSETKRLVSSLGWKFYQKETAERFEGWQTMQINKDGFGCSCHGLGNIALRKKTSQSTTCYSGISNRAVDGNTENVYIPSHSLPGSCSRTCSGSNSWWMVDFGQTALVQSITITNRGDSPKQSLSDFDIRIGESSSGSGDDNALSVSNGRVPNGGTKTFKCTHTLTGRYLYIKTNLQRALILCEVKVFGEYIK